MLVAAFLTWAQAPPPQPKPQPPAQATTEHRITPEEAKELLGAVDEVLAFDSRDTQLPIKHAVKRQLVGREQVQSYVEARMKDDPDAARLQAGEAVLKKFGLLPQDFDLEKFLVELLREQVAGYYDPKTKTVNLLDWLPPETQLPVLAHELTHALQDQNFDLEKWIRAPERGKKTPEEEIRSDEALAARQAVSEGQAMAAMIDYLLQPVGGSVLNSPTITQAIEQGMGTGSGSPVFERAPLYLQRLLLFPYSYGLEFERVLLQKGGKERAFAGVLKNPPQNTRQVMEPEVYLAGEPPASLPLPDFAKLLGGEYEKYDVGSVGEFDVAAMAELFGSAAQAKQIYPQWRAGYYWAAKKKSDGPLALVFVTKWGTPQAAAQFAQVHAASVKKRYPTAQEGGKGWSTPEGPVVIEAHGDMLLVTESLDEATTGKVRKAILGE